MRADDGEADVEETSAVHARAGIAKRGERGADVAADPSADIDELFGDGIIHASTLAQIFTSVGRGRWSTRRAKRFLKRSGIGFQMGGPTDEWATTTLELKEHYPQLWRLVEAKLADLL